MAEVTVEIATNETSPVGGFTVARGDAFARTSGLNFTWNNSDANDFLGTDNKVVNPENVMFMRYRMADIGFPPGATILRAYFKIWVDGVPTVSGPSGKFRVGFLNQDGKWSQTPFSRGFTPGAAAWQYANSFDLPFPTDPGSDVVKPGKIWTNKFQGTVEYTTATTGLRTIGDASTSPEFVIADVGALLNAAKNVGWQHVAWVFDPFEVPAATPEWIQLLTDDSIVFGLPKGTWGPHLVVTYDQGAPTITSPAGPLTGAPGVLYNYGPLTASDPFPGNSATVTFDLVSPLDGASVINDAGTWRFDWTPSGAGSYLVQLRATDQDGFTSPIQSWTVVVPEPVAPTITSPPGPVTGTVGVLYNYGPLTATDPDSDPGDITFDLVSPLDGASVINDAGTWRFDWTPTTPGRYPIQLQAEDELGLLSPIQSWIVNVQPPGGAGEVCGPGMVIAAGIIGDIVIAPRVAGVTRVKLAVSGALGVPAIINGSFNVAPVVGGSLEVEKCR